MTESTAPTGAAKRRARTRAALLDAARALLAEGRTASSIETITKRAGVGFGSFFNHFPGGKDELFEEAVLDLLDGYAAWVREATTNLDDPAEIFARSFRLSGRLALAEPTMLAPLLARGTDLLFLDRDLRRDAIADVEAGLADGRFRPAHPLVHVVTVGSLLLGLVDLAGRSGQEGFPTVDEAMIDATAAAALRTLGLGAEEAEEVAARPLPPLPPLGARTP